MVAATEDTRRPVAGNVVVFISGALLEDACQKSRVRVLDQQVDAHILPIHVKGRMNLSRTWDAHAAEQQHGHPLVNQAQVLNIGLEFEVGQTQESLALDDSVEGQVQPRLDWVAAAVAAVMHLEIADRGGQTASALPLKRGNIERRIELVGGLQRLPIGVQHGDADFVKNAAIEQVRGGGGLGQRSRLHSEQRGQQELLLECHRNPSSVLNPNSIRTRPDCEETGWQAKAPAPQKRKPFHQG